MTSKHTAHLTPLPFDIRTWLWWYIYLLLLTSKRNQKPSVSIAIDGHSIDEVQYTRFLGVYIDNKLNWKKHIAYISGKVWRGIGLIVKARKLLNASALTTLYYSFIYPFFTYCNHVWGCAYESNLHLLVLLQKRIVRIITSSKYRDHSEPLIERLKLLKIGDINKYVLGKFMYILYNNEVPTMFHAMFQKVRSVHGYETRQSNHLYIPKVRTNLGKCKLSYRGPMIWNSILAAEINPETSEAVFAKTLKQCIKVGLLRWFDIYFDFGNFYERKKCCDVTGKLPLSYMDLMCLKMHIILRICLLCFSFNTDFVFVLFSFLHSCTWHSCTLSDILECFNVYQIWSS